MKKLLFSAVLAAALAGTQGLKPGATVADFELTTLKGETVKYSALKGDVTVVIFVSTVCPISNGYNDRMKAVYGDYSSQAVHFIFVNANTNESPSEVAGHAQAHKFPFPVYKDTGAAADLFGAQVTPETFVIDKDSVVRYHGYVDDSVVEARVHNRGLRTALDAVLSGKPVATAETKAFGCTIKRRRRAS